MCDEGDAEKAKNYLQKSRITKGRGIKKTKMVNYCTNVKQFLS